MVEWITFRLLLTPIEQVWSWIRQHCLSNRVFSGYEEIVDEVSKAWDHFISIPDRVTKMFSREWIVKMSNDKTRSAYIPFAQGEVSVKG
ncbi:hypothetical protein PSECIP111854_04028 [Pseudoalteromonas sp. CIP111854]|uniref:Transposase n=1 Tax=Pseudoalteromonas holothuriae TaxID=2963714 RepID=A0A9W4R4R2_9GAMM|nr:hypothetical protein PSECIP111854_04028 [Pseudoalteromonas sp. CIP111854]